MTRRSLAVLAAGAFALAACSTDGEAAGSDAAPEAVETVEATPTVAPMDDAQASTTPPVEARSIPDADPPPPVDVIGIQDQYGMRWAGQVYHKDRMRWEAPDPSEDYFIIVIRELTEHHASMGLEVGKAYRYRGMNQFEYIRDVDLSQTDEEIARSFGAFSEKPVDVLFAAAETDDVEAVRGCLESGLSPDTVNRSERPVLMVAAQKGSQDVVRVLLDAGARVELTDVVGENALHQAARGGHADVVSLLLDRGAEVDSTDALGHTPLFFATEANSPEVAEVLIEHGADVSLEDQRGYTPLAYARVMLRSRMKPELRELLTPKD